MNPHGRTTAPVYQKWVIDERRSLNDTTGAGNVHYPCECKGPGVGKPGRTPWVALGKGKGIIIFSSLSDLLGNFSEHSKHVCTPPFKACVPCVVHTSCMRLNTLPTSNMFLLFTLSAPSPRAIPTVHCKYRPPSRFLAC